MGAVGTRIAPRPPHRSRRALLTHRALIEGRTRSAFGVLGTHTAPIRGLTASVTCHIRLCVRDMRCCLPFLRSAAFPPPSPPPILLGLVRGFIGTMQPSDSSCLPGGLRSMELPRQARNRHHDYGQHEASQVPYKGRSHVHGVSDCARLLIRKPVARRGCCLLVSELDRHLEIRPVSQLNTQPVVSPVNASSWPSRAALASLGAGAAG
jgi:hypothetical protein